MARISALPTGTPDDSSYLAFDNAGGTTNRALIKDILASQSLNQEVTLPASGWSASAPYTQTVTVLGMKSTDMPQVSIKAPDDISGDTYDAYEKSAGYLKRIDTATDSIIAYCPKKKPTVDLVIYISVIYNVNAGAQELIQDYSDDVNTAISLVDGKANTSDLANYLPLAGGKNVSGFFGMKGLYSINPTGTSQTTIQILPMVPFSLIDSTHTLSVYLKELIKWVCATYPGMSQTLWIGNVQPNSRGFVFVYIYATNDVDDDGYPQYGSIHYFPALTGASVHCGFNNYSWYYQSYSYSTS